MNNITLFDLKKFLNFKTEEEQYLLKKAYDMNKCISNKMDRDICKLTTITLSQDFHADNNTILATLIYKACKSVKKTDASICQEFNKDVLDKVRLLRTFDDNLLSYSDNNKRNLVKSITSDVKVTIIKLVERLNTLKYIEQYLDNENDLDDTLLSETLKFYAKIAELLGVHELKIELEDICFKYNENYKTSENIKQKIEEEFNKVKKIILPKFAQNHVNAEIIQNKRSSYDLFLKSQELKKRLSEINDKSVIDVSGFCSIKCLVEDINLCYQSLGIIHQFNPLMGFDNDYLSGIQGNEYRSFNTYVFVGTCLVDFRICTKDMNVVNSYGICSNWEDNPNLQSRLESNYDFYDKLLSLIEESSDFDLIDEFQKHILDRLYMTGTKSEVTKEFIKKIQDKK